MTAMIGGWWTHCSKAYRAPCPADELARAARAGAEFTPSGPTADFLSALGWDGRPLVGDDLSQWIQALRAEEAQGRAARLRPWERGAAASRPALLDQYRIGRQAFKRLSPLKGLRTPSGWIRDLGVADCFLLRDRAPLWSAPPPSPPSIVCS